MQGFCQLYIHSCFAHTLPRLSCCLPSPVRFVLDCSHCSRARQQPVLPAADAPANVTYGNFTSDRIFHSPTDLNWVIARVLVFNDSDTTTALTFSGNITLAPYNAAGAAAHCLLNICESELCCIDRCLPLKQLEHVNAAAASSLCTQPHIWMSTLYLDVQVQLQQWYSRVAAVVLVSYSSGTLELQQMLLPTSLPVSSAE